MFNLSLVDIASILITLLKEEDTEIHYMGRVIFRIFILNVIFNSLLVLL